MAGFILFFILYYLLIVILWSVGFIILLMYHSIVPENVRELVAFWGTGCVIIGFIIFAIYLEISFGTVVSRVISFLCLFIAWLITPVLEDKYDSIQQKKFEKQKRQQFLDKQREYYRNRNRS
ncbi:MAG: hypothetical protein Q4D05_03925 [Acinetobacter sp.]|nr:hypothetical protein [Acinetobacter sp.]